MPWETLPSAPAPQGITVFDIAALPEDEMHWELVDGVPRVLPRPTLRHQHARSRLVGALDAGCPAGAEAIHGMSVVLDEDQLAVVDVIVAVGLEDDTDLVPARQVLVAAEVVDRSTRTDDRFRKPAQYAQAGIGVYVRVELDPLHVIAYELGTDGVYVEVARAEPGQQLRLARPFPVSFDPAVLLQ